MDPKTCTLSAVMVLGLGGLVSRLALVDPQERLTLDQVRQAQERAREEQRAGADARHVLDPPTELASPLSALVPTVVSDSPWSRMTYEQKTLHVTALYNRSLRVNRDLTPEQKLELLKAWTEPLESKDLIPDPPN